MNKGQITTTIISTLIFSLYLLVVTNITQSADDVPLKSAIDYSNFDDTSYVSPSEEISDNDLSVTNGVEINNPECIIGIITNTIIIDNVKPSVDAK